MTQDKIVSKVVRPFQCWWCGAYMVRGLSDGSCTFKHAYPTLTFPRQNKE